MIALTLLLVACAPDRPEADECAIATRRDEVRLPSTLQPCDGSNYGCSAWELCMPPDPDEEVEGGFDGLCLSECPCAAGYECLTVTVKTGGVVYDNFDDGTSYTSWDTELVSGCYCADPGACPVYGPPDGLPLPAAGGLAPWARQRPAPPFSWPVSQASDGTFTWVADASGEIRVASNASYAWFVPAATAPGQVDDPFLAWADGRLWLAQGLQLWSAPTDGAAVGAWDDEGPLPTAATSLAATADWLLLSGVWRAAADSPSDTWSELLVDRLSAPIVHGGLVYGSAGTSIQGIDLDTGRVAQFGAGTSVTSLGVACDLLVGVGAAGVTTWNLPDLRVMMYAPPVPIAGNAVFLDGGGEIVLAGPHEVWRAKRALDLPAPK